MRGLLDPIKIGGPAGRGPRGRRLALARLMVPTRTKSIWPSRNRPPMMVTA